MHYGCCVSVKLTTSDESRIRLWPWQSLRSLIALIVTAAVCKFSCLQATTMHFRSAIDFIHCYEKNMNISSRQKIHRSRYKVRTYPYRFSLNLASTQYVHAESYCCWRAKEERSLRRRLQGVKTKLARRQPILPPGLAGGVMAIYSCSSCQLLLLIGWSRPDVCRGWTADGSAYAWTQICTLIVVVVVVVEEMNIIKVAYCRISAAGPPYSQTQSVLPGRWQFVAGRQHETYY